MLHIINIMPADGSATKAPGHLQLFSLEPSVMGLHCLVMVLTVIPVLVAQHGDVHEYCHVSTFNATCPLDQVVVMGTAQYGRMSIGTCVTRDLGYLGCAASVLNYMDFRCSGRHTCQVPVVDVAKTGPGGCPGDVTSYLEASYSCVHVSFSASQQCLPGGHVVVIPSAGYLASITASERGQGTVTCPWVIRTSAGQRVNLTLHNFARTTEVGSVASDPCYELAVIVEGTSRKSIVGCARDPRVMPIHQSTSDEVQIYVKDHTTLAAQGIHYLLQYDVSGCPQMTAPPHTWVRIEGLTATVRCNSTGETWYLTCRGTEWVGHYGNCSGSTWDAFTNNSFPYGIVLIVAIGVALGVFCGGLLLFGVSIYMRRRQARDHRPPLDPQQIDEAAIYDKTTTAEGDYTLGYNKSRQASLPRTPGHFSGPTHCPHGSQFSTGRDGGGEGNYSTRDPRMPSHGSYPRMASSSHLYESPQFKQ